jgi:hypothetical protein
MRFRRIQIAGKEFLINTTNINLVRQDDENDAHSLIFFSGDQEPMVVDISFNDVIKKLELI